MVEIIDQVQQISIAARAFEWCTRNGLSGPFVLGEIRKVPHGWTVVVTDTKDRQACCSFRNDGKEDMYERLDRTL